MHLEQCVLEEFQLAGRKTIRESWRRIIQLSFKMWGGHCVEFLWSVKTYILWEMKFFWKYGDLCVEFWWSCDVIRDCLFVGLYWENRLCSTFWWKTRNFQCTVWRPILFPGPSKRFRIGHGAPGGIFYWPSETLVVSQLLWLSCLKAKVEVELCRSLFQGKK